MIDVHYYVAYLVCISGGWWWNFSVCRFCGELHHGRVALLSATSLIMHEASGTVAGWDCFVSTAAGSQPSQSFYYFDQVS
jgi:hypothetical protein